MKESEYIKYPTWYDNAGGRHWNKILISDIKEKDKIECYSCNGTKTQKDYDWKIVKCDVCEWRWWVYSWEEWEFSCNCWMTTCWADCPDNIELDCECMEDD